MIICLFFASMLISCNGGAHTHTYKSGWSKDGVHHWHECEDEDCNEVSEKSAHSYGSFASVDNTKHKKICQCGAKITEDHSWNNGEIIPEATPDVYGSKIFTCIDCGHTKNGFPSELITTMTGEEYYLLLSPLT